ncbi:MAG: MFS transporter [Woeseiaceae bacterium]|nr:MFS transporter [Woeseiaceae bacterium]
MCSGFGQTYYIAVFAGHFKTELSLTDGEFGSLYALGTLTSAALLTWAGKLADTLSVRWLGAGVLTGLAFTSLAMARVDTTWMLGLALFGLRFFGQGMSTHVAMTAMARWFNRKRGQAISIAALGLPASEAIMPLFAVSATAVFGWRATWLAGAVLLGLVCVPLLIGLLQYERHPTRGPMAGQDDDEGPKRYHWTRDEVLRHPLFYALLPVTLATAFIITAIFINQVSLAAIKGWQLSWFAASFPVLAAAHVVSALACGRLIDLYGARWLLPVYLVPLGLASLLLAYASHPVALPIAMTLIGINLGCASTTQGALWAELYGVGHLGAIRSVSTALVVFASALSPGLVGILMDAGIALERQILVMAIYCFAAAAWTVILRRSMERVARQ